MLPEGRWWVWISDILLVHKAEARHIVIIQALLAHRSRLMDRTPLYDVSVFPLSRVMCARAVTSMVVHSTQPGGAAIVGHSDAASSMQPYIAVCYWRRIA